ncbi:MAG: ribbon-helix-helix protein, CopG family [Verrucomicrobiae bacterium]|nr:ribbon-helix-helix protein, CopG family [Verrucomicrobiae bacterium]
MALGSQLPIRLDPETDSRLRSAAAILGTSKSALIRLLAKSFCDQVVQIDGSIVMPPEWRKILPPSDGRSERARPTVTGDPGADEGKSRARRKRPK